MSRDFLNLLNKTWLVQRVSRVEWRHSGWRCPKVSPMQKRWWQRWRRWWRQWWRRRWRWRRRWQRWWRRWWSVTAQQLFLVEVFGNSFTKEISRLIYRIVAMVTELAMKLSPRWWLSFIPAAVVVVIIIIIIITYFRGQQEQLADYWAAIFTSQRT